MTSSANTVDMESRTAIGKLLLHADECSKRVLTAYNPTAAHAAANTKALKKFNLDILEPCAEYLNIRLADDDGNKIFTKDSLVPRIILGVEAHLPSKCSECSEQYTVDFNGSDRPLYHCFMCFQGSHDCSAIKAHWQSEITASIDTSLLGSIWLCHKCHQSSNPVKPRKSRCRHDSLPHQEERDTLPKTHHNEDNPQLHQQRETDQTLTICDAYKVGSCPHGISGKKLVNDEICPHRHPKRCKKYCRNGPSGRQGCKRGDSCKFYHPTLCKYSLKKRLCTNDKCKFVHLTGTARKAPSTKTGPVSKTTYKRSSRRGRDNPNLNTRDDNATDSASFLELKALVQKLTTSFEQELASVKALIGYPRSFPPLPAQPGLMPIPYPVQNQLFKPAHPGGTTIPPASY